MTKPETTSPLADQMDQVFAVKAATKQPQQRLERAKKAAKAADFKLEEAVRAYNKARIQLIVDHIDKAGQNWCQYARHLSDGPVRVCSSSGTRWAGSHYDEHIENYNESRSICDQCWSKMGANSRWSSGSSMSQVLNVDGRQLWIDEFHRYIPYQAERLMVDWEIPPAIVINYPGTLSTKYTIDGKDLFAEKEKL